MQNICPRCTKREKISGYRSQYCRPCKREYDKKYYQHNKKYLPRKLEMQKLRRKKIEAFLFKYLTDHPCHDCKEKDIVVLDFDHTSMQNKLKPIAQLLTDGCSIATIKTEIAKCIVRCANCHRRRTAVQLNSWRLSAIKKLHTEIE